MEIRSRTPGGYLSAGTSTASSQADHEIPDWCGDDAQRWAQRFVETIKKSDQGFAEDEATMVGWFANAIEAADRVRHGTGPQATFFKGPGTEPHVNTDVKITLSLNGKLLSVDRGDTGEELYGVNWVEFDNLTGRLLTLCDATFTDPIQRKAFKDMVRQHIKEWANAVMVDAAADAGQTRNHAEQTARLVEHTADERSRQEGEATP